MGPPAPELALGGSFSLGLVAQQTLGDRKAAVSFHTALTLARQQVQWKPNPCHDPISPTMAEPPLTGRGSQECGSSSASHI